MALSLALRPTVVSLLDTAMEPFTGAEIEVGGILGLRVYDKLALGNCLIGRVLHTEPRPGASD